jgi:hypothetical protein
VDAASSGDFASCCFDWKYSANEFIVFLATVSAVRQSRLTDFLPAPP